jgi:hypothetical protein
MRGSRAREVWEILAINGICLAVIGLWALGFDFVTRGEVTFLSDLYGVFLLTILKAGC